MKKSKRWAWIMLFSRIVLFMALQSLLALTLYAFKVKQPWVQSEIWWPFIVITTNIICLLLLVRLFKADGKRFWDIYKIDKTNIKKDLITVFVLLLIIIPTALLPNIILTNLLFTDIKEALGLIVRPMPFVMALVILLIFPLTQGLVEIPLYFSYVMPKLEANGHRPFISLAIPAIMLGLQHVAVPFIFDFNYGVWRALMFMPFAFLVGIIMRKKPKLFPYIAIIHILMDLSFAVMFLFDIV